MRGIDTSIEGQPQLRANPRQYGIEIIRDFRVCEAHDVQAEPFKNLRPIGAEVREPFVLLSVGSTASFAA